MADTLREVAQEAVARVEGAPDPNKITDHGMQVAGILKAEADKDVFTTLQIAAGEQVSPAILRANIDVSIGILKADGTIDATGPGYAERLTRAKEAVGRVEKYFDDQLPFEKFAASPEGKAVVKTTTNFLITHPALSEYFANFTTAADRTNAAKALAEKYLQDPFARERVRQALLETQINKGEVADEYSEVARKKDALAAKVVALEAKIKKLEGDLAATPPVVGEIETMGKRRREFDRYADPAATPPVAGTEFALSQTRVTEVAGLSSDIAALDADLRTLRSQETTLQNERRRMQKIFDASGAPARDPSEVDIDITAKQTEITSKLTEKSTKEGEKATKEAEIKAIEEDRKQLDEKIKEKIQEAKALKDELSGTKNERDEQILKLTKLEAGKGRAEELAVSELENVFKKGIEQELMERLERAKEAADKALEESAEKSKDIDEKQYRELRAKRHKTPDGKVDGKSINEDFTAMMTESTEYHIIQDPTNPNKVILTAMPAGGWPATGGPARNEVYYLTGPELAIVRMMNSTDEFGGGFILGKLKDAEWLQTESQDFLAQTLQDKMYASRGWLQRRRTGVKRLSTTEVIKIKNSTWGKNMLEQALEQNKEHVKEMDDVMKSDILQGPGSWKEKIGRMSNKQIALLILGLTAGGALLGPIAWPAIAAIPITAAGIKSSLVSAAVAGGSTAGGAAIGAGAGAAAAAAGRSRTS